MTISDLNLSAKQIRFLAKLGGYECPWTTDTRNQHLKRYWEVRRVINMKRDQEIFKAHLLDGKTFRQIGRKQGISHTAAWKAFKKALAVFAKGCKPCYKS